MRITVKIFGPKYFGLPQYDVVTHVFDLPDRATAGDIVELLEKMYPGLRGRILRGEEIIPMHDIWVNGRSIQFLQGLATRLKDGDIVQLVPPFGG